MRPTPVAPFACLLALALAATEAVAQDRAQGVIGVRATILAGAAIAPDAHDDETAAPAERPGAPDAGDRVPDLSQDGGGGLRLAPHRWVVFLDGGDAGCAAPTQADKHGRVARPPACGAVIAAF